MGNKDDKFVEERRSLLERFMKELAKFDYLTQSKEFKVFARDRGDIDKILGSMTRQTPIQILEKYRQHFNIDDSSMDAADLAQYKENIINFSLFLKRVIPQMEVQKKQLKDMIATRETQNRCYSEILSGLSRYEDNNVDYYSENDVTKRILTNPVTGSEFTERYTSQIKSLKNPFKEAYYWFKGELLDLKGL